MEKYEKLPECINEGEAFTIKRMLNKSKFAEFKWFDGGNGKSYNYKIRKKLDINFAKVNEALWVVNGNIIKFSTDKNFIKQRVQRQKN